MVQRNAFTVALNHYRNNHGSAEFMSTQQELSSKSTNAWGQEMKVVERAREMPMLTIKEINTDQLNSCQLIKRQASNQPTHRGKRQGQLKRNIFIVTVTRKEITTDKQNCQLMLIQNGSRQLMNGQKLCLPYLRVYAKMNVMPSLYRSFAFTGA